MNLCFKDVWRMCFSRSKYMLYLTILVLIIFVIIKNPSDFYNRQENPLDGCLHVYLDVGANRGVQVRKLYEPHLFPEANILKTFSKYFGDFDKRNLKQICAVGFEPNPIHEPWLTQLSTAYQKCGWRVDFKTKTGVDKKYSNSVKYAWFSTGMKNDVGQAGRLVEDTGTLENEKVVSGKKVIRKFENLTSIRLAEYILNVVAKRKLPKSDIAPMVVMKVDIEGKELEVILDIIVNGALGALDEVHIEWTTGGPFVDGKGIKLLKDAVDVINKLSYQNELQHQSPIEDMDDETYYNYNGSLPIC